MRFDRGVVALSGPFWCGPLWRLTLWRLTLRPAWPRVFDPRDRRWSLRNRLCGCRCGLFGSLLRSPRLAVAGTMAVGPPVSAALRRA